MRPTISHAIFIALAMSLIGCGGGSGGGSGSTTPPPPPPPPVDTIRQYDAVVSSKGGDFSTAGNTVVEYHVETDTLVFQAGFLGYVTVGPSRKITRYGVEYVANFAPGSGKLLFGGVISPSDFVAFDIVLVSFSG